jgi:hypothetical protein
LAEWCRGSARYHLRLDKKLERLASEELEIKREKEWCPSTGFKVVGLRVF